MKNYTMTLFIILISISNIFATVWTVDDDSTAQFIRIQDAIDVAQDGDTVFVFPGTYEENLAILFKTIWLIGSGKDSTFIHSNIGYLIYANNGCYIYEFTIDGNSTSEVGIALFSNSIIKNNIIKDFQYSAIKIPFGPVFPNSDILIEENIIVDNHIGIHFDVDYPGHPDSIKIIANTISGNDYGIIYFPMQVPGGPPFDTTWNVNTDSNYWGFSERDSIDKYIWDKTDTSKAIAQVHYNSWFDQPIDTGYSTTTPGLYYNNIYNNHLYNIYAFNDQGTGIKDFGASPVKTNRFQLQNNYPNPFNASTTINFKVFKTSVISLVIHNTLGEIVEVLINKNKILPGKHKHNWNASNLSSGIYFIKLYNAGNQQISKAVLIK